MKCPKTQKTGKPYWKLQIISHILFSFLMQCVSFMTTLKLGSASNLWISVILLGLKKLMR